MFPGSCLCFVRRPCLIQQGPYGTLYSNIDVGAGTRWLLSGGDFSFGTAHSASYTTFWNIKAAQPLALPDPTWGPNLNFIGTNTAGTPRTGACAWVTESVVNLYPPELHTAQSSISLR